MKNSIKRWSKVGKFKEIFRSPYGQFIGRQTFRSPLTNKNEEFFFYGEGNGVRIFGLTQNKRVIVIEEYQHAADKIFFQLPTGGIKKGETPLNAARRELIEETGYKSTKIIYLGESSSFPRSSPTKEYSFLALDCIISKKQNLDSSEQINVREISIKQWLEMIKNKKVPQDPSISATFRSLLYLGMDIKRI